uniref:Uncharacterized protein n=1 Tax=Anopheles minimus TaxID=112268 RepID=A0A182WBC7_9DIPT
MAQHNGDSTVGSHQQCAMFEELREEIAKINPFGETIEQTYHMRKFAEMYRCRITNDQLLSDLLVYLNEEALCNSTFAIQFANVFASRQLADASLYEPKIRNGIIGMLQQNFLSIERLKQENMKRFFNSVTLLGQYYYRKRVAFGKRIQILGQSLFLLLTSELEQEINESCAHPSTYWFNPSIAKLVMAQLTLNGEDAKVELQKELNDLLYTMRKALIVIPNMCAQAKALLMMALDLHYMHLGEGQLVNRLYGKYLTESDEQPPEVSNGDRPKENGIETAQPVAAPQQPPPVTNERRKEKQTKKVPGNDASGQNATGSRSSTSNRPYGGGDKTSNQNNTTNDKENKRRSTQTKVPPVQKTSPNTSAASRSIRLQEDGNIVATITRDTSTTTSTKKQPPSATSQPPSNTTPRSSTAKPKPSGPRMEKLATLPKITITSATPSPKRTQDKSGPVSPRAVLGPSIGKQKPHPPPKSPTHSAREGQYASKSVPQVSSRARHDRRGRTPAKGTATQEKVESDAHKETVPQHQHTNGDGPTTSLNGHPETDLLDWRMSPVPERDSNVAGSTKEAIKNESHQLKGKNADGGVTTTISKGKPSYFREENVENLSWDALIPQDDESPQKVNPHTKSFLSFLASE